MSQDANGTCEVSMGKNVRGAYFSIDRNTIVDLIKWKIGQASLKPYVFQWKERKIVLTLFHSISITIRKQFSILSSEMVFIWLKINLDVTQYCGFLGQQQINMQNSSLETFTFDA